MNPLNYVVPFCREYGKSGGEYCQRAFAQFETFEGFEETTFDL